MRIYADCIPCMLAVRLRDVFRVFSGEDERLRAMRAVLRIVSESVSAGVLSAPRIATRAFRWIKEASGVDDPYEDVKRASDEAMLSAYPGLRGRVLSLPPREALEAALRLSAAGNLLDVGVASYKPPGPGELLSTAMSMRLRGDVGEALRVLGRRGLRVLMVLDNAGEAVLDRLLADVLREAYGCRVVGVVKSGAFQNDETLRDAERSGLAGSFDELVGSGSDAASIFLEEASPRLLEELGSCDVIVSKGMANYEYLTDVEEQLGKTIVYVLAAKCRPIALDTGVGRGEAVVRVHAPGGKGSEI